MALEERCRPGHGPALSEVDGHPPVETDGRCGSSRWAEPQPLPGRARPKLTDRTGGRVLREALPWLFFRGKRLAGVSGNQMLDLDFITDRLAVGGAIFTRENFEALIRAGITHIINTQMEFDDSSLRRSLDHEPRILWLATDDDFQPKPAEFFFQGVRFALDALERPENKVLVHCASGIHRGPMLVLAILRVLGYGRHDAISLLRARRPQVDFPEAYLDSVEAFLAEWETQ